MVAGVLLVEAGQVSEVVEAAFVFAFASVAAVAFEIVLEVGVEGFVEDAVLEFEFELVCVAVAREASRSRRRR